MLTEYLHLRLGRANCGELFITTTQPYKRVSSDTLARWIKTTMTDSGIDTGEFSAHSCRAASRSTASLKGVSLTTIIRSASWTGDSTFKKFYLKEIRDAFELNNENIGSELLKQFVPYNR